MFAYLQNMAADVTTNLFSDNVLKEFEPKITQEIVQHMHKFLQQVLDAVPEQTKSAITARGQEPGVVALVVQKVLLVMGPQNVSLLQRLLDELVSRAKPHAEALAKDVAHNVTTEVVSQTKDFMHTLNRSTDRSLMSSLQGLLKNVLDLDAKLPELENRVREKVDPVFEAAKPKLWEAIIATFQSMATFILDLAEQTLSLSRDVSMEEWSGTAERHLPEGMVVTATAVAPQDGGDVSHGAAPGATTDIATATRDFDPATGQHAGASAAHGATDRGILDDMLSQVSTLKLDGSLASQAVQMTNQLMAGSGMSTTQIIAEGVQVTGQLLGADVLRQKVRDAVEQAVPDIAESMKEPMKGVVSVLVEGFKQLTLASAKQELREVLAKYHLV